MTPRFLSLADGCAMIRGDHIDLAILGAMQTSEQGDLANWTIPDNLIKGMSDPMDRLARGKRVAVVMEHTDKSGGAKFLHRFSLPLTGTDAFDAVIISRSWLRKAAGCSEGNLDRCGDQALSKRGMPMGHRTRRPCPGPDWKTTSVR